MSTFTWNSVVGGLMDVARRFLCCASLCVQANGSDDDEVLMIGGEQRSFLEEDNLILPAESDVPDVDVDLPDSSSLSTLNVQPSSTLKEPLSLEAVLGKNRGVLTDIVINVNPAQPPKTLLVLHSMLCQRYRVLSNVHAHSSIRNVPPQLMSCLGPRHPDSHNRQLFELGFTLIWKDVPKAQMRVKDMCPIEGEGNVARFLYKLLATYPSEPAFATLVDFMVDTAFHQLREGSSEEQAAVLHSFNSSLGCSPWIAGQDFSLADIACYCVILQSGLTSAAPMNVQKWLQTCEDLDHFGPAKLQLG
ncbi:aminoacyl tRNA synthase complex-interacting multifunctional protein 2-like [Aulostomus maculatus]